MGLLVHLEGRHPLVEVGDDLRAAIPGEVPDSDGPVLAAGGDPGSVSERREGRDRRFVVGEADQVRARGDRLEQGGFRLRRAPLLVGLHGEQHRQVQPLRDVGDRGRGHLPRRGQAGLLAGGVALADGHGGGDHRDRGEQRQQHARGPGEVQCAPVLADVLPDQLVLGQAADGGGEVGDALAEPRVAQ